MTTLGEVAAHDFGFNPDQKRGFGGKWIHVGAAVKHAENGVGEVVGKHIGGKVSVRFGHGIGVQKVDAKDITSASGKTLGDLKGEAKSRIGSDRAQKKAERHEKKSRDKIVAKVLEGR
jgi:hypothetical protein